MADTAASPVALTLDDAARHRWVLDPQTSTLAFRVRHHAVATYRARFADIDAVYDPITRRLTGTARTASVVTFDTLKEHLLSHEFFSAQAYPEISFESTATDRTGDAVDFEGLLTLRGTARPVSGHGRLSGPVRDDDAEHLGLDAEFTIDRREFGVGYNNRLLDGSWNLGWDVTIELALEFVRPLADD